MYLGANFMNNKTFRYVMAALFAALTCVATYFIHIPVPMTNGYANLGDAVILLSAFLFPSTPALIAAGVGAALADAISGYGIYIPATFVIKAGVFAIAMLIGKRGGWMRALAAIAAELFMVLGYLVFEMWIVDMGAGAVASIPGNLVQAGVSAVVALVVTPVMLRSSGIRKYVNKFNHD